MTLLKSTSKTEEVLVRRENWYSLCYPSELEGNLGRENYERCHINFLHYYLFMPGLTLQGFLISLGKFYMRAVSQVKPTLLHTHMHTNLHVSSYTDKMHCKDVVWFAKMWWWMYNKASKGPSGEDRKFFWHTYFLCMQTECHWMNWTTLDAEWKWVSLRCVSFFCSSSFVGRAVIKYKYIIQ